MDYKEKSYDDLLGNDAPKEDKEKILERAWATRNFEIELYWKRTIYLSTIIGALFYEDSYLFD